MKIHLLSYGNHYYENKREDLRQTALKSKFFTEVKVFGFEDLDFLFVKHFAEIFKYIRGGGYWIWKPYLIKKMLNSIDDDDILIYCDAGCELNFSGEKRFFEYIDILKSDQTGSLAFELPHKEIEYTKKEVFNHFKVSEEIRATNQLVASAILLRKCNHTLLLVEKWFETLVENPTLFTDEKDLEIQDHQFIDHRHDQSIFSLIRKIYGSVIIPDETYFLDFKRDGKPYPIWTSRKRDMNMTN